jgi:hypothetical protein
VVTLNQFESLLTPNRSKAARPVQGRSVPESFPAGIRLAHFLGQADSLLDDLRGFDGPVLITPNGLLQHLGERAGLNDVLATPNHQRRRVK